MADENITTAEISKGALARMDRLREIAISDTTSGAAFTDYRQVMEFAQLMSEGGSGNVALPPHLRGRPYMCLAICTRAMWWRLDPFFVAEHSYEQDGKLSFDSSIFQAIVNSRAPIKYRLKHRFVGEGDDMRCIVWSTFIGENDATEHISPRLGDVHPGHSDKVRADGKKYVRGSPLWDRKPQVQLAYDTMRDWARLHCADILGGIYDRQEIDEYRDAMLQHSPKRVNLMERLPGAMSGGFKPAEVEQVLAGSPGNSPPVTLQTDVTSLAGYEAHLTTWLASKPTRAEVREQWEREQPLLKRLLPTPKERRHLADMVEARCKELEQ